MFHFEWYNDNKVYILNSQIVLKINMTNYKNNLEVKILAGFFLKFEYVWNILQGKRLKYDCKLNLKY